MSERLLDRRRGCRPARGSEVVGARIGALGRDAARQARTLRQVRPRGRRRVGPEVQAAGTRHRAPDHQPKEEVMVRGAPVAAIRRTPHSHPSTGPAGPRPKVLISTADRARIGPCWTAPGMLRYRGGRGAGDVRTGESRTRSGLDDGAVPARAAHEFPDAAELAEARLFAAADQSEVQNPVHVGRSENGAAFVLALLHA